MGREFNLAAYSLRLRALGQALEHMHCELSRSSVFEASFGVQLSDIHKTQIKLGIWPGLSIASWLMDSRQGVFIGEAGIG